MKPPIEFEIDGVAYKARRMDIFTQGDIARKISPLAASAVVQFARAASAGTERQSLGETVRMALGLPMDRIAEMAVPFLSDFAKMSGEDFRFVVRECLACVEKNSGTAAVPKWAGVWPAGMQEPMFPEFREDLFLTMRVVISVIKGTLGNFMTGSR